MEEKLKGLVVSSVNYGENDKILNVFTLEKGMVSARIKGVKRSGAKLKFASEPFCFAEFVFVTTGDKRTVRGASLIESFYSIREDLIKLYAGSAILEFIKHFEIESMVSPQMFLLAIESLKNITYGTNNASGELCRFFIEALKIVGYGLKFDGCFKCGCNIKGRIFFDYVYGGFFCEECSTDVMREINYSTFIALKFASEGQTSGDYSYSAGLRLINFYILNKAEEKLKSLVELIKLLQ